MKHAVLPLLLCIYLLSSEMTFAHHSSSEHTGIGSFTMSNFGSVRKEIGLINAVKLYFMPKEVQGPAYHVWSDDTVTSCEFPNKWYLPEGDEQYCDSLQSVGITNFVCGAECPTERQTGLACGMGHHCCKPGIDSPEPAKLPRCDPGNAATIQFCSF